uniref:recombinase family protein n=1 Tax=Gorillibacterium massiliense TaxID=1280390 RepID=UPI00138DF106
MGRRAEPIGEKKQAAIYVRVSTEDQGERGYSLEAQIEDCLNKATEMGYRGDQVEVIADEASGAVLDRPGMNRLRDWIESREPPKTVILYDPDRLSRKLSHQLLITEEMIKYKIALVFVNFTWNNTPEGRMFYQLRGMFAEFEREKIRERTIRGRLAKVKNHGKLSCNPRLYGYCFDTADDVLRPDPEAAATVRRIFALSGGGESAAAIARRLAAEGVPAPRGSRWYGSTVSRILRNPSYLGTYTAYKVDYHQGWRRVRPPEERFALPLAPLVEPAAFAAAAET